ncbi:valine--tRNA ligase [Candidatus Falkowbacteria bacterium]|nr:MAG: valine--tRNA ligase [Candidatus Falkowbacteria bacterium]
MPELPKAYNPANYEDSINRLWQESGFFNPDNLDLPENAPAYTIILPPPNVTDRLHLGHASMLAIQDLLIRFHRMQGFRTLWVPGTDHAAIATQTVVERKIYKEEGKTRHDLGREEFLKRVKAFALENQSTIINQIKSFGASLDWSRLAFTLDEERQTAVRQMFVDMYEAGAIYRGERIVNWCPHCQSTLADDEVEYKTEKTVLYTFKYWPDFPIAISSTRPETKLGDTAVAVNPSDDRYKQYIGQEFSGDFCGQALTIKIIADREVDMSFGTGALGVTPAHSHTDWRMAEENNLMIIKVIDETGKIKKEFGDFSNLSVIEAREKIITHLREQNLISQEEETEHNLSVCYRCGTPIEPLPSKQWFVAVGKPLEKLGGKSLKAKALEVSEAGKISFTPDRFKKRYEDWMKNLRDWCISRQIWFGHSIPVWYRGDEVYVGLQAPEGDDWKQDTDTLDTWFSSGMWTFSTLGWATSAKASARQGHVSKDENKTGDLAKFHPTDVLETGYEIITLWVSRMIMMSLFALDEIPFKNVYLHGMVLDALGKKMSKSKGNGIDPLEVSHEYGTDAVRLALLVGNTPGVDVRLSKEKIGSYRNFTNKLWNISRYILSQEVESNNKNETLADRWIQSRLQKTIEKVGLKIRNFEFSEAGEILQSFTLSDLADWYLEVTKFKKGNSANLLPKILETLLKLWHPFMPFVTETIWKEGSFGESLLMVAEWPTADTFPINQEAETDFEVIQKVISAIRTLRSENRLEPAVKLKTTIYAGSNTNLLLDSENLISSLKTGVGELVIRAEGEAPQDALFAALEGIEIYIEAPIDSAAEKIRLEKEIEYVKNGILSIEKKLSNIEFKDKAPAEIIASEENKLVEYKIILKKLSDQRLVLD